MKKHSVGICLGASTIKLVKLAADDTGFNIIRKIVRSHESNPVRVLREVLYEIETTPISYGMVTGRKFRTLINADTITEPEAIEYALMSLNASNQLPEDYSTIVSLGAETFISYSLSNGTNISNVETGNKCASGTGEFFLQQINRMNIDLTEAIELARNSEKYLVSGRCSVFCKSDCTHALNKGIPINRVTAGLCHMIADKVLELLKKENKTSIIAVGGVTKNSAIMDIVRNRVDALYIPDHADAFEALGAAYYALVNEKPMHVSSSTVIKRNTSSFTTHPPIQQGQDLVSLKTFKQSAAQKGDECIVGLDVGSTTTKAVLLRMHDSAVLSSTYLRTNGNPIQASRSCYAALDEAVKVPISIIGLGATGAGRQIAGLHAETDGVINEIIAHATGAAYFDKDVDTIFEIGGQDAKYTYLTNSVPSDYAMNEACSAGTGSFLEESARESLGLDYLEIAQIALQGKNPPNFNDQCAAFISSDIKTAIHEGVSREDIVAGLVYSICLNYINRVKGQRPVGKKIFMQGGVCYNKAVPLAMANLIEQEIIVPPEPGLIGAFGVALEIKNRMQCSLYTPSPFNLAALANREISYGKNFICKGTTEQCDRGCEINVLIINNKKYTFGGVCNKYYNLAHDLKHDSNKFNFVKKRQTWVFSKELTRNESPPGPRQRIGISRSYLTNRFYPLYATFFNQLHFEVVLSNSVDPEGTNKTRSSFCYPAEIAHGCFSDLLKKQVDYIFLPKIMGLKVEKSVNDSREHQSSCVLLQSEAYYLKSTFKDKITSVKMITPVIDFSRGIHNSIHTFISIAKSLGCNRRRAKKAFNHAIRRQEEFHRQLKRKGGKFLQTLERHPDKFAIVLF